MHLYNKILWNHLNDWKNIYVHQKDSIVEIIKAYAKYFFNMIRYVPLMIFVYEMVQEYQKDIKRRNFLLYQQTKRSIGLDI